MKKNILWLMLSFLLVAALVLASCAPAVPGEQEEEEEEEEEEEPVGEQEEEEEEEPAVGEPQYGGTITYLYWDTGTAGIPSLGNVGSPEWLFIAPVMEYMAMGDIEEYGPRGSGEYPFSYHTYTPMKWMKGALAESWEVTLDKIIVHIRPGVYFTGESINPVMERREYTADDYVNNLKLIAFGEGAAGVLLRMVDIVEDVYAEDKYTAVIETKTFHPEWWFWLWGWYETEQYPLELSAEDRQDWKNLVGTGPWILTEEAPGSHMAYKRNPDYWRTTTINGKEYPIPFADKLVMPLIPDPSTAVSALRTGTLDFYSFVGPEYTESLDETCPELLKRPTTYGNVNCLFLKCDEPPFDNKNVRRALMIGTDRQSIHEAVVRLGPTYCWPCAPGTSGYIPLEDLPAETRLLFDYNPDLARQMLRDEGIPDGFKMKIYLEIRPDITGTVEMLAGMWLEDLGIEVEAVPEESVAFESRRDARDYQFALATDGNTLLSYTGLEGFCSTGGFRNFGNYSNEYFDQRLKEAGVTVDPVKREAILEELFLIAIDDVPMIPMSMPSMNCYWWPWVKNYWGEPGSVVADPPTASMWIDQDLKVEMGH